mmetsp:Transcript_1395/g.5971  ORF Transcript_1395/g.5971 Transcript_1395/m.5971 type:complete len:344 (+) Transcript_1395:7941-8972(+)
MIFVPIVFKSSASAAGHARLSPRFILLLSSSQFEMAIVATASSGSRGSSWACSTFRGFSGDCSASPTSSKSTRLSVGCGWPCSCSWRLCCAWNCLWRSFACLNTVSRASDLDWRLPWKGDTTALATLVSAPLGSLRAVSNREMVRLFEHPGLPTIKRGVRVMKHTMAQWTFSRRARTGATLLGISRQFVQYSSSLITASFHIASDDLVKPKVKVLATALRKTDPSLPRIMQVTSSARIRKSGSLVSYTKWRATTKAVKSSLSAFTDSKRNVLVFISCRPCAQSLARRTGSRRETCRLCCLKNSCAALTAEVAASRTCAGSCFMSSMEFQGVSTLDVPCIIRLM